MSPQEILPPPSGDDCICQQRDGESPDNDEWPEWLTQGCPLHDPNAAPCEGCGECGRLCSG